MKTEANRIQADVLLMRFTRMLKELKSEHRIIATVYLDELDLTMLETVLTDYLMNDEEE